MSSTRCPCLLREQLDGAKPASGQVVTTAPAGLELRVVLRHHQACGCPCFRCRELRAQADALPDPRSSR